MVAAAVGVGTAVAGVASASMSSSASKSAANTQADAAQSAADQQWKMFQQYQQNLSPYMGAGQTGLAALMGMLGLPTNGITAGQAGGASGGETEQQIRDRLTPKFTSQQQTTGPGTGIVATDHGGDAGIQYSYDDSPVTSTNSVVDQAGLNAAVQAQLQQQQQSGQQLTGQAASQFSGLGSLLNSQFNAPAPFSFNANDLDQTPGYQFTLQQGLKALNNQNSAQGLGQSGAQQKGLLNYATGLSDNTYGNQFNRALSSYQTNYNNSLQSYMTNYGMANDMYNRLSGLAGMGQNAAAGVGNAGMQTGLSAGNFLTSGANAQAAGQIGSANAINGGISSIANGAGMYSLLNNQSNQGASSIYGGNFAMNPNQIAGNGAGLTGWQ